MPDELGSQHMGFRIRTASDGFGNMRSGFMITNHVRNSACLIVSMIFVLGISGMLYTARAQNNIPTVSGNAWYCIFLKWGFSDGYDGPGQYLKIGSKCERTVILQFYRQEGEARTCVKSGVLEGAPYGGIVKADSERHARQWNEVCADFIDSHTSRRCYPGCR